MRFDQQALIGIPVIIMLSIVVVYIPEALGGEDDVDMDMYEQEIIEVLEEYRNVLMEVYETHLLSDSPHYYEEELNWSYFEDEYMEHWDDYRGDTVQKPTSWSNWGERGINTIDRLLDAFETNETDVKEQLEPETYGWFLWKGEEYTDFTVLIEDAYRHAYAIHLFETRPGVIEELHPYQLRVQMQNMEERLSQIREDYDEMGETGRILRIGSDRVLFLSVFFGFLIVASLLGITVFGTGMSGASVIMILRVMLWIVPYTLLGFLAYDPIQAYLPSFFGLPLSEIFFGLLSLSYFIGVTYHITSASGEGVGE